MNTSSVMVLETDSPEETDAFGRLLGSRCQGGELLLLRGELGAGKTLLVRGIAAALGCDPASVCSPSYTLQHRYPGRLTLNHFDAYFTTAAEDLERSALEPCLAAGEVVVMEWGERFSRELPADRLWVEIAHEGPTRRRLELRAEGERSRRLLEEIRAGHS